MLCLLSVCFFPLLVLSSAFMKFIREVVQLPLVLNASITLNGKNTFNNTIFSGVWLVNGQKEDWVSNFLRAIISQMK